MAVPRKRPAGPEHTKGRFLAHSNRSTTLRCYRTGPHLASPVLSEAPSLGSLSSLTAQSVLLAQVQASANSQWL